MPDTTILKTTSGWIDRDEPNTFHRSRRLARDARRSRRPRKVGPKTLAPAQVDLAKKLYAMSAPAPTQMLTGLQRRAYSRLMELGVATADADVVVPKYGYNAAVSYGHMRAAGATHPEAIAVIELGNPDVSLSYGLRRQSGQNHADALRLALDD